MSQRQGRAPTIVDIAARAGVSKSAVSRALTGTGHVSPEARLRIEQAASSLGYVANAMARGLVSSRTNNIGVVLRDLKRPFYAWLFAGMQSEAERRGFQIVAMTSAGELEVPDALHALRNLVSLQVDGLVLASARVPAAEIVPFVPRVPIVVAGRREDHRGITSVFCDHVDGGNVLADHVLQLGYRRPAVVLVEESYSHSQHTLGSAMIARLRAAGLPPVVWQVPTDAASADAVAEHVGATEIDAIMCPTDAAALDVLEVLRLRGTSVPDELGVTGYDGFGIGAAPYLGLTTLCQPVEEIGRTAVGLLVDRIEGVTDQDRRVALHGELIPGRTTRILKSST